MKLNNRVLASFIPVFFGAFVDQGLSASFFCVLEHCIRFRFRHFVRVNFNRVALLVPLSQGLRRSRISSKLLLRSSTMHQFEL